MMLSPARRGLIVRAIRRLYSSIGAILRVLQIVIARGAALGDGGTQSMPRFAAGRRISQRWAGSEDALSAASGAAKPIWLLILALAAAAAVAKLGVGVSIGFRDILGVGLIVIIPLAVSAVYAIARKEADVRIARLARAAVEMILLTFLCGSLSYSATSLDRPLWDAVFHAWDQAIGFDWRYWLAVLDGQPRLNMLLVLAYHSMWPLVALVIMALVTVRDYRRLDVLLLAFGLGAVATVTIAAFMPALSPLPYYQITPSDHPHISLAVPREFEAQALALRSGAMRVIELSGAQGLVTFPSFHTVTAILLLLGFWRVPYLRWVSLVLNGLMLLAIPIEGSHYLVDVIAAVPVALMAWKAAAILIELSARATSRHLAISSRVELPSGHPEGLVPQLPTSGARTPVFSICQKSKAG